MIEYGQEFDISPQMLPSGWLAFSTFTIFGDFANLG
jgi:hypothetical protein